MVTTVTSFGRSGLSDWLVQRVSALILAVYSVFMVVYLLVNPQLDFAQWHALFSMTSMRIFSLMALLSLGAHCWIGLWSISTDYLKPFTLRFVFQMVVGLLMFIYTVWGVQLLWGL
ncbi:succinate dehydrogenase, hydrophobic membrane anchor protein [Candidatus Njordibacter sp. Uisw_039]|jgi:succinate dehydrogenase / fumarate reductase membrane anchor subunit|uniref:succinate dehydrogenase, hydrophobic membrane anchor protein n=1 Tax=Candidatus Njordibacter sp. Uisw_039 TaxID=3230972 RepID=UPI003A2F54BB|tara:strand:- start:234 stop:581 length:348 start_codon:yes stop_codon:yes gene_type:complete